MKTVILTQFFPWTFLMHLIRALIAFNVSHTLLKDKYNIFVTFISVMGISMLYSYFSMYFTKRNTEILILILYYILIFSILCFTSAGTILQKAMAALFSYIANLSGSLFFSFITQLLFKETAELMVSYKMPLVYFLSYNLFEYAFSFVFIIILKIFISKKEKNQNSNLKYAFLMLFPATHIFGVMQEISGFINIYSAKDNPTLFTQRNFEKYSVFFTFICLIIDFSLFFIIDHFEKIEITNKENQKYMMKNQLDYYQVQLQKQENNSFRKIKHDYINITNTAKGLIEIGQPEKALKILSKVNDDMQTVSGFSICSNETINTIIYAKKQQAQLKGINLETNIEETSAVLINDYDLCRILGNIIDNALNAVALSDNEKLCKIDIDIDDEKILIKTENSFNPKQNKIKKSELHGNGIGIIKDIVSNYYGDYSARQEKNIWFTETYINNINIADSATPPPANFDLMICDSPYFNKQHQPNLKEL